MLFNPLPSILRLIFALLGLTLLAAYGWSLSAQDVPMDLLARQQPLVGPLVRHRSDGAGSLVAGFSGYPHQSGAGDQHGPLQWPAGHGGGKRVAHSPQM